ncbi:MAG: NAD(P)H-dependent oxidoreductase subunit E [Syntrophales bacterium]
MKAKIRKIVQKYGDKSFLVPILQDMQKEWNYLPKDVLKTLSTVIDVPISRIYEVATFYKAFSLTPRGRHTLMLCRGTACHVRGTALLDGHIERNLGIKNGETSPDLEFTYETVNCLGACALGPILVVDGQYHGHMDISKVDKIIKDLRKKVEASNETD